MPRLLKKAEITELFKRFRAHDPAPETELVAENDFCLLVSIVLSAQATDVSVNAATPALFAIADTPEKMFALGEAKLKPFIQTIGLYNAKAKNVIALSKQLVEQHGGIVPEEFDTLITLPGVGRKTANVWLNVARGHATIAVDTHVFRVSNRLGLCRTKTPDQTEAALMKAVPDDFKLSAHHWLILHGRYICKARLPECWRCIVNDICQYANKVLEPPKSRVKK